MLKLLTWFLPLLMASSALAQIPVTVQLIDGTSVSGRLAGLRSDRLVLQTMERPDAATLRERIVSIEVPDAIAERSPAFHSSEWLLLTSGDWLRAAPQIVDDETLTARWSRYPDLPSMRFPLDACRGLLLVPSSSPWQSGLEVTSIFNPPRKIDLLTLRNGDRIEGEFQRLHDAAIEIESAAGLIRTDLKEARSLVFNPDLIADGRASEATCVITLKDGSMLRLKRLESDGDTLIGTGVDGYELSLPVLLLQEMRFFGANRQSLTTLVPAAVETTPFLTIVRRPLMRRNVLGGPLRVRGRMISDGIGVTSGTRMEWMLNGEWAKFLVSAALDDAAEGQGSVRFEVQVDGRSVWRSEVLTGRSAVAIAPAINLTGAKTLTLTVDAAGDGPSLDYADWLHPALLK